MANTEHTWINDVAVPHQLTQQWERMKELQRAYADARTAFESAFNGLAWDNGLSRQRQFIFNYRFGKLSIAETDADRPKTRNAPAKGVSLLDYLRQNSDRRI